MTFSRLAMTFRSYLDMCALYRSHSVSLILMSVYNSFLVRLAHLLFVQLMTDLLNNLGLTTCSQCTCLNAIPNFDHKLVQPFQCRAANLPVRFSIRGNYVGHCGCIQESTVYALIWAELLAQYGHVVVRCHQGVEGIDSFPRVTARMGTPTCELAVYLFPSVHSHTTDAVRYNARE